MDTKSKIFTTALRLFSSNGYDNVSMREIAGVVGINSASIYYHYSCKEDILDDCYNYYIKYRHGTRMNREQYEPVILHGTKNEVLNVLNFSYPDSIIENIIMSLLLIFSRIYSDTKAMNIYADEINSSMQFLNEFFSCGIQKGRFHEFNIQPVSLIFLSTRLMAAQSVSLKPEQKQEWRAAELDIFNELTRLIPFKY